MNKGKSKIIFKTFHSFFFLVFLSFRVLEDAEFNIVLLIRNTIDKYRMILEIQFINTTNINKCNKRDWSNDNADYSKREIIFSFNDLLVVYIFHVFFVHFVSLARDVTITILFPLIN